MISISVPVEPQGVWGRPLFSPSLWLDGAVEGTQPEWEVRDLSSSGLSPTVVL